MPRGIPKHAAEGGKLNRAEIIRKTAKAMGKTVRPRDVIVALKEQGIAVTYSLVSKTLKKAGFHRKAPGTKAAAAKGDEKAAVASGAGETTKAQRIRDVAKSLGKKVRPRDVVAELAKEGVTVTSPQVSKTLAAAGYRRRRRGKKAPGAAPAKPAASTRLSLDSLLAAKALIEKVGGVEAAEQALHALKRLG